MSHTNTLILGIGNTLLTDEGAGLHALHQLELEYPDIPNLTYLDGGTLSFTLATWIEDCDNLIILDAAQLQQPAGSIRTVVDEEMDNFLGSAKRSVHEVGLMDLMDIARLTDTLPQHRGLVCIQPEYIGWGMEPTPAVQKAIPAAVAEVVTLIEQWHDFDPRMNHIKAISHG